MILALLSYLLLPAGILYLTWRSQLAERVGSVMLAYLFGIIIGNIGVLPQSIVKIQEDISAVPVLLAIPLLLFSSNVREWFTQLRQTVISMLIGVLSVVLSVVIGYFFLRQYIPEIWKISGLLAGVYTGGTPNLASIKIALHVDNQVYIVVHTYDMVVSAAFLVFVMSIAKKILEKFLPSYRYRNTEIENQEIIKNKKPFFTPLQKETLKPLAVAFTVSIAIVAVSAGIGLALPEKVSTTVVILLITTLGILASLIPKINTIHRTFDLGMYFILVFSIIVASMADFSNFSIDYIYIMIYIIIGVFGSFLFHVVFAKIFRIDADNVIIVSTALACSPPFVPLVASAIRNREIIISGITVGIIGYAIGNYLGVSIAYILSTL